MKILAVVIPFYLFITEAVSQNTIVGRWKTIDDESGKVRSVIELSERGGKVFGRIIRIFAEPHESPDPVCDQCDPADHRYNKKIIGMEILEGRINGKILEEGTILDPENGKIYKCKVWLEGEVLKVRGYWGPFYRTQTWLKA